MPFFFFLQRHHHTDVVNNDFFPLCFHLLMKGCFWSRVVHFRYDSSNFGLTHTLIPTHNYILIPSKHCYALLLNMHHHLHTLTLSHTHTHPGCGRLRRFIRCGERCGGGVGTRYWTSISRSTCHLPSLWSQKNYSLRWREDVWWVGCNWS